MSANESIDTAALSASLASLLFAGHLHVKDVLALRNESYPAYLGK